MSTFLKCDRCGEPSPGDDRAPGSPRIGHHHHPHHLPPHPAGWTRVTFMVAAAYDWSAHPAYGGRGPFGGPPPPPPPMGVPMIMGEEDGVCFLPTDLDLCPKCSKEVILATGCSGKIATKADERFSTPPGARTRPPPPARS